MNPKDTIAEVKRLVGLRFKSPVVEQARQILPYDICAATNGDAWVTLGGEATSPQEIQAYILEELAASASKYLGSPAERVIITVPAFFDETQRQAVRDSATIAGLRVERIISEPTAAALAYGYAQYDNRRIAVVDLGGGTLDVTVMSVDQGRFEVLSTDGDNLLGGIDFDRSLAMHFASLIQQQHGVDVTGDPVAMQRLLGEAEATKKGLTDRNTHTVQLPYLAQKDGASVDFECTIDREQFRALVAPLVERVAAPCRRAVEQAKLRAADLDDVILVGGMTRSPVIQDKVTELFQRKPLLRVNPDEAIAIGASLLGASVNGQLDEVTFVDVAPRSIGLKAAGDRFVPLIKKSTTLPARCRKGFRTTRDEQTSFELDVLQGESAKASENRRLAHITIEPITRKPKGEVVLAVEFEVDPSGALVVHAKEQGSTESIQVKVDPFSGLTSGQVSRLAAEHAQKRPVLEFAPQPEDELGAMGGFSISISSARKKAPVVPAAAPAAAVPSPAALSEDALFGDLAAPAQEPPATAAPAAVPAMTPAPTPEAPAPEPSAAVQEPTSNDKPALPMLWIGIGVGAVAVAAVAFFALS